MFWSRNTAAAYTTLATLAAVGKSQAMIEFALDGTILTANANFLTATGYALPEIQGRHHSLFVEPAVRESAEYKAFWAALARGEFQAAEYKRLAKGGREVWIQASYNPVLDRAGRPLKIVKIATDVTRHKLESANHSGQVAAIHKSQAVIEFDLDGTILGANENFLTTMGYALPEIQGRHHSLFVEPGYRDSPDYKAFWAALRRGEYRAAEYKRLGKGGREVWIQASYNPILDLDGRPFKVVKFATDVTRQKLANADYVGQIDAIHKSQAVIEFNLDGTIITANRNFLDAMGYALAEIEGKHHAMFVEPGDREGAEYKAFWAALARGEYQSAEYKRLAKGGREVWIQASYNPILDLDGKACKVVKFATDVTQAVLARKRSEHVRDIVESVAAGAEELNASVKEIADAMAKSRDTANSAATRVESTDQSAQRLAQVANAMGGIVEVIADITGQINLLALNATIESARAGEAGRGFAVVANEVKNLANQARQATERIGSEIDLVRAASGDVVGALNEIKGAIDAVRGYVTSTAASVAQQSSVAHEMSANMQRAAAEAARMG